MVVIEHQESEGRNPNLSNTGTSNDASDDFETSSDTDLDSDVDTNGGGAINHQEREHLHPHNQHTEQEQDQEHGDHHKIISFDDASINEEELKQEALVQANEAKVEGDKLFLDSKYEEALTQYELGLQIAPYMPSSVGIRSICHANRGVCFLKMGSDGM